MGGGSLALRGGSIGHSPGHYSHGYMSPGNYASRGHDFGHRGHYNGGNRHYAFNDHDHHGHDNFHHRGHGHFVNGIWVAWPGWYGGDYYGYSDCGWLQRQAAITGSPYWWSRYNACIGYDYY